MARSRALVALALVTCFATSCSSAPSASESVLPAGTSGSDPAASATPSPSPPAGTHALPDTEGAALPPGSYTKADFTPQPTFRIGRGWHMGHDLAGFFDVQQKQDTLDVIAVQFARPYGADSANAVIRELKTTSGLKVTDRGRSTIAGRPAREIQVDSRNAHLTPARYTPIFSTAAGSLYIGSGRRLLVDFVETHGALVAVLVGGSVRNWAATMHATQPVVRSIHFL